MSEPLMTNEDVDEKEKLFVEAVEYQNRKNIIGSIHILMLEDGTAMLLDYIPDKFQKCQNKIRLIHAITDWAKK